MKDAGNLGMKGIAIADIYHLEWETSENRYYSPLHLQSIEQCSIGQEGTKLSA